MSPGWSIRGDINDEKVARDVELCLSHVTAFFDKFAKK